MSQESIYVAGPITGRTYDDVVGYYKRITKELRTMDYRVYCPMAAQEYIRTDKKFQAEGYPDKPASTNHAIVTRDRWMVLKSDIILANFSDSGSRVSIGTVMEIGWATDSKKLVIGVIPKGNIHRHAFVLEACSVVFETLDEALIFLKDLKMGVDAL